MNDPRFPGEKPRLKLALTQTGGETTVAGDPRMAELLAHALDVAEEPRERLTHGFHSYPARMHWATAQRLLGELDALLRSAGAAREDMAGIGVGVGPGSYTGVRIGVSTARALGRAWGVPVGGSSSLLALMDVGLEPGATGVALLDARKGNVYAQMARRLHGASPAFEPVGEPVKVARSEVEARYPGLPLYEGPPDAAVLARRALLAGSLEPWYL